MTYAEASDDAPHGSALSPSERGLMKSCDASDPVSYTMSPSKNRRAASSSRPIATSAWRVSPFA